MSSRNRQPLNGFLVAAVDPPQQNMRVHFNTSIQAPNADDVWQRQQLSVAAPTDQTQAPQRDDAPQPAMQAHRKAPLVGIGYSTEEGFGLRVKGKSLTYFASKLGL